MLPPTGQPFVLLDDARPGGAAPRLYRDPVRVLRADDPVELPRLLGALKSAQRDGLHAAGYLSYEAGLALEPALINMKKRRKWLLVHQPTRSPGRRSPGSQILSRL